MSMTLEYNNKSMVIEMLEHGFDLNHETQGNLPPPNVRIYASALTLIEAETGYSTLECLQVLREIVAGNKKLEDGYKAFEASRAIKPAESAKTFAAAYSDFAL